MNKKLLIVIIPVFILLTGCQLNKTQNNSLTFYKNADYGITLQYPSNWNIFDKTNLIGVNISPEDEKTIITKMGAINFNITKLNKKASLNEENNELNKFVDMRIKTIKNLDGDTGAILSKEDITIDGKKVIRVTEKNIKITAANAPLETKDYILGSGIEYYFFHKGQMFIIGYNYSTSNEAKYKNTLDSIAMSLKFDN